MYILCFFAGLLSFPLLIVTLLFSTKKGRGIFNFAKPLIANFINLSRTQKMSTKQMIKEIKSKIKKV